MNKMATVIKFTFRNKFQSKSFIIMTIIFAVLISAGVNLPSIIQAFSSDKAVKIGVIAADSPIAAKLADYYAKQEKPQFEIIELPDTGNVESNVTAAKKQVEAKEIKGYLQFSEGPAAEFPQITYYSKDSITSDTGAKLRTGLQAVKTEMVVEDSALSQEQLNKLFSPVSIQTVQISDTTGGKSEAQMAMSMILVYVMLILLFMGVIAYGNMVAAEITAEKSSRVMEILITSVSPLKQMFGKIIGICLLGLLQLVIIAVIAVININLPNNRDFLESVNLNFSDISISMLIYFPIFYLAGYLLYSTLFAAIGSMVSRTEDLAQAIMPVTFLSLAGFYIAIFGMTNPTNDFVVAMSFVPFFTPFIMFLRIGLTDTPFWQVGLSIIVLLGSIFVMGWFAAKIYRTGVLMYGKRPSLKELRKAMKAFKV